jgi:hypothetical protein
MGTDTALSSLLRGWQVGRVFGEGRGIVDPRVLAVEQNQELLFLSSIDRALALDPAGRVVRDNGLINRLNPGLDWRGLKCCLRVRRLS